MAIEITDSTNESELRIRLINGASVRLYGSDNPDSLRGIALWGVVYDEYSQQPAYIHTEIIRPALSDHQGWGVWIGTPKGKNLFYDLFKHAQNNSHEWLPVQLKASESGILPATELLEARKIMSQEEYDQEYEVSFDSALIGAYYRQQMAIVSNNNQIRTGVYDPFLPVYTFWDLGMSDYTSIVFAQFTQGKVIVCDYLSDNGKPLSHYTAEILAKQYKYHTHYLPHDARVRDLTSGMTREDLVRHSLHNVMITPNIPVKDGIEALRVMLPNTYFEDSKTEGLRECLLSYRQEYDHNRGIFKDNPRHDEYSHGADAMRYLSVVFKGIQGNLKTDFAPVEMVL